MATYANLTCATAADCSSHSDRLVCTAHGVCGCPWREQLTSSDPEGGRSASKVLSELVGLLDTLGAQGSELQRGALISLGSGLGSAFRIMAALQVSLAWLDVCESQPPRSPARSPPSSSTTRCQSRRCT